MRVTNVESEWLVRSHLWLVAGVVLGSLGAAIFLF